MTVGRKGLMRESLKQLYKEFYSLKDKKVNVYDLPAMTYVITSGANNIYESSPLQPSRKIENFTSAGSYIIGICKIT